MKKIDVADSFQKVEYILGKADSKRAYFDKTYLIYYVYDDFFSLFLSKNRFPYVGFFPLLRTGTEYWVILSDNKVLAFGPASNFKNNLPRALSDKGIDVEVFER